MGNEKKVSCIIPSYKRCDTVTRAIDSVLAQTYKNIEVCIVDDNVPGDEYSQNLQKALERYEGDRRVRYITQEQHINGAAARNVGIRCASGEYISFLDDDDEWLPTKIERQMDAIQSNPSIDAVTTLWIAYCDNKEIRRCAPYSSDSLQFKVFLREVQVFTSTLLIKKEIVENFGGFDESLKRHQDLQFLVDALSVCRFEVLNEYMTRLHTDSEINKPNIENFIKAKKDFFNSVREQFEQYTKTEKKRIRNAHCYEIAFQALKGKKYGIALKYGLRPGINIASIIDLFKRMKNR